MSSSKFTILATPINAVGHVHACMGALSALRDRGRHRIVFVVDEVWQGKLLAKGYEEYIYKLPKQQQEKKENAGEAIAKMFIEWKIIGGDFSPAEKMANLAAALHSAKIYKEIGFADSIVKKAIEKVKPDVIYFDGTFLSPSIYFSGLPWIANVSAQPICHIDPANGQIPPGGFGLPTVNFSPASTSHYDVFVKLANAFNYSTAYNDFLQTLGYDRFPGDAVKPKTEIMTVYAYPTEINYPLVETQENWFNLEVFNKVNSRKTLEECGVPSSFLNDSLNGQFSGRLILISMGSMASIDLQLMKRLIEILGTKTKQHKYIVSKGPRHEEYDSLPANMWGDRFVQQTDLLPHVDLVILHGGNNSVTETFAMGKPMVILPIFGDQFDNAQRLEETGLGRRLDTYKFTDDQLVDAINELLENAELKSKLKAASERILSSRRHEELADRVEQLLLKTK